MSAQNKETNGIKNTITLSTLLSCCRLRPLAMDQDNLLDSFCIERTWSKAYSELCMRIADPTSIDKILTSLTDSDKLKAVLASAELSDSEKTEIEDATKVLKKNPLISDRGIYELYNSMDPEWKEFSKQLAVMKHSRFIHSMIVKKYSLVPGSPQHNDLYFAGICGLIQALDSYDATRGYALMTFATPFVIHELSAEIRHLSGGDTVYYNSLQNKIKDAEDSLISSGLRPTIENIAILTDMSVAAVKKEIDCRQRKQTVPIDGNLLPIAAKGDVTDPEASAIRKQDATALAAALKKLNPDEREILQAHYINEEKWDVIAQKMNRSTQEVKNIHLKAIKALRRDQDLRLNLDKDVFPVSRRDGKGKTDTTEEPNYYDSGEILDTMASVISTINSPRFQEASQNGIEGLSEMLSLSDENDSPNTISNPLEKSETVSKSV